MRVLYLLILYLAQFFVGIGHAQGVSQILAEAPSCTHHCIINAFTHLDCDFTNVAECLCTNVTLQTGLSECTQTSCLFADQVIAANIEMELCVAYPKASRSQEVTRITIASCALVLPIIALRLYTRIVYTKRLWTDDYATILATILLTVVAAVNLYNANQGLGMHYWAIPVAKGTLTLKLFYFNSMIYMILLVVGKMSILLVYLRIFPDKRFRHVIYGLNAFLVFHGILYFLLVTLQCLPVDSIWDRYITNRRCIDTNAIVYSSGILSIFEDIAILLLPMRQVWRLNIHRRRRLTLLALFSIGSLYVLLFTLRYVIQLTRLSACLTSMIRMKYVVKYSTTFDATWDSVDIVVWSTIEQFSAMLCGSLPTLRPLVLSLVPKAYSNVRDKTRRAVMSIRQSNVRESTTEPDQQRSHISSGGAPGERLCSGDDDGIKVTRTVDLRWESTWFEDSSQHSAEDVELEHDLPQQPPAVLLTD